MVGLIIKIDKSLVLKQISLKYTDELFELVISNKGKPLLYWCPDMIKTYASRESTKTHIEDALTKFTEDKTPDFLIFYEEKLAGLISLSPLSYEGNSSEVGYWLSHQFVGKGLITKSLPSLIDYAKGVLKLNHLDVFTSIPNERSQKIPLKFGFKKIKILKEAERLEDMVVDHIWWRLELESDQRPLSE